MTDRRQGKSDIHQNEQRILNWSFDEFFQVLVNLGVKFNPTGESTLASIDRDITDNLSVNLIDLGDTLYIGDARIGELTSSSVWRVRKLDLTNGVKISWADGNGEFDNVFDNYASLNYS